MKSAAIGSCMWRQACVTGIKSGMKGTESGETDMIYETATMENRQDIHEVVQRTIKTIYPKYYPAEVVDFFCGLHSEDAIAKDIENGSVGMIRADGRIVATGCFVENHITRVYVLPEYQKRGLGTQIMKTLEARIGEAHDSVYLDASLPAAALYKKLGFHTVKHERYPVENGVVLVYEIMEKAACVKNKKCSVGKAADILGINQKKFSGGTK